MLEIINFSKVYRNGKQAVKGLNLTIEEGDLFAFIGHNGAGKTTTIKAIVGILDFEEGDILIKGVSVKKDPIFCKKQIAYIPDNPDLYDNLTGIQYLNLIADIFEVPKVQRAEIITKYAKMFELTSELNNFISSYSHGMKQKLAIISAMVHSPKILILDEPFVGLDPKAAFSVKQMMKEFCANGGSIFFSTHILEVAEKLCNKIAIIKNGELIAMGNMEDITKDASLEDVFLELTEHA
ncbi:MAG TPA: ABC transporter ATP-binding protein [Bacilli bacterium]|jgi:ABC-2 type transport system ATP-binding protein|nr:ABC transporter ATP-binding protein [Bacilli bacterium]HOR96488.1 ABC transporter ATP-binding protein [Bacilli bacterium]HPD12627.1 ABC transporter ATP-binding protein [Bacilli bacterium]HPK58718.1 ABC transporter ATP-binding protein [Bacilli bacterium]HPN89982.1 ABC transporter ATP-binding protein [Bacilli bacterium]